MEKRKELKIKIRPSTKEKYYTFGELNRMGISETNLKNRFYRNDYKKYGIEIVEVVKVVKVKKVSHSNFVKFFKQLINRPIRIKVDKVQGKV